MGNSGLEFSGSGRTTADCRQAQRRAAGLHASALKQLSGVHQSARIQGLLERSHELELEGVLVAADFLALELPQAMLGRYRAPEARHRVVDDPVHCFTLGDQRLRADVVMQVAVAHMAED